MVRVACAAAALLATAAAGSSAARIAPDADCGLVHPAPGDTDAPAVYIVNDSISKVNPFTMTDIGLIDIVQPDSALAHYGTRNVIRVYTREFVRLHPGRFPGVPVIAPDTIPPAAADTHAVDRGGAH